MKYYIVIAQMVGLTAGISSIVSVVFALYQKSQQRTRPKRTPAQPQPQRPQTSGFIRVNPSMKLPIRNNSPTAQKHQARKLRTQLRELNLLISRRGTEKISNESINNLIEAIQEVTNQIDPK